MVSDEHQPLATAFAALQLPAVLAPLVVSLPAGRAKVVQGPVQRFVWFSSGRIRSISSSLESERLGNWVIARGLVDRKTITELLASRRQGERIGDVLVRRGLVGADRLGEELRLKAVAMAARMLLEPGTLECEPVPELAREMAVLEDEPRALFVLAARRSTDMAKLEALLGGGLRLVALPRPAGSEYQQELTGVERYVLSRLETPRSLQELRGDLLQQGHDLVRAVAALVAGGLVIESNASARSGREGSGGRPEVVPAGPEAENGRGIPAARPDLREVLQAVDPDRVSASASGEPSADEIDRAVDDKRRAYEMLASGEDRRAAYRLLARGVEVAPDADGLVMMARIEVANPLWRQKALDHLKKAIDLDPKATAAWIELANYWSLRGEPDKQLRCLEAVLRYDPKNGDIRRTLDLLRASHS
jgi:tetratricopeptide (TPR) repeat protein